METQGKNTVCLMKNNCVTSHHAAPNTVPPTIFHIIMFLEVLCIIIIKMGFNHVEILKYTKQLYNECHLNTGSASTGFCGTRLYVRRHIVSMLSKYHVPGNNTFGEASGVYGAL